MKWTYLLIVLLVGCGSEQSDQHSSERALAVAENHGFGYAYDEAKGDLRVRSSPLAIEYIDSIYVEVEICIGVANTPRPLVIFIENYINGVGGNASYFFSTATVIIDRNASFALTDAGDNSLRHEFIHHILSIKGEAQASRNHSSEFFRSCSNDKTFNWSDFSTL